MLRPSKWHIGTIVMQVRSLRWYRKQTRNIRITLPEYLICSWLIQAIDILSNLHEAGFAHRDAHTGNWFLRRSASGSLAMVLGDFDDTTRRRSTKHSKETQTLFQSDYKKLAEALTQLLLHSDRPTGGPLSTLLTVMYRCSHRTLSSGISIDQKMRVLRKKAREVLLRLPPPTSDQNQLAQVKQNDQAEAAEVPVSLHVWFPRVARYAPISPDPGFEIVASRGWSKPFLKT